MTDLVSKLTEEERIIKEHQLESFSPDDGKYADATKALKKFLTPGAEWLICAYIQLILLETRKEFGKATSKEVIEVSEAFEKVNPLNMSLLESKVTYHDQLAVIEEIGRFVSPKTKALLHPGTTSYDILDTARSYLIKRAWKKETRPKIVGVINQLCDLAEESLDILQIGRTHLQHTSPVPLSLTLSGYAARLTERVKKLDSAFDELKGKISGIVGTGASIEMVIGRGKALDFEKAVLTKLDLKADYTATQVVQKEGLADVGHGLVTLMHVLGDFAGDIRKLYSSEIKEVTSRDSAKRLGGSSADPSKDNPINYENIEGKTAVVEGGMRTLYAMINTDFQRDLRSSVQARYQPQLMMVEVHESFSRASKALKKLSINIDKIAQNLQNVRDFPSEAMTAILKGEQWLHSKYGIAHNFVKEISKQAKAKNRALIKVALQYPEFARVYRSLPPDKKQILNGILELYKGASIEKTDLNIKYARSI